MLSIIVFTLPTNKLKATFELDIEQAFTQKDIFTKDELEVYLRHHFPDAAEKTISWRIHDLKSKGIIKHVSRGMYSLVTKKNFQPEISNSLKRINNKICKEFPFVQFCLWESKWFNEIMVHQLFKNYLIIETEKDVMESIFNSLTDFSKKVYLNPDHEIFERYIANVNDAIIIKPLVSEAPVNIDEQNGIHLASLEKLLVDSLIDTDLFAAQQNELEYIYSTVMDRYNINISKLNRYARRRNQQTELSKYLPQTTANK
ncbi:MAG: hypothetical protein H7Y07_06920 [Pyrinomonadaceae bacterium]|nr:hypothetical protein [Sphingobacteriaceae bacterium]